MTTNEFIKILRIARKAGIINAEQHIAILNIAIQRTGV
jgi:hypothetical protein